jgi:23S rRNA (uracil1939-C5)-methyltransferase
VASTEWLKVKIDNVAYGGAGVGKVIESSNQQHQSLIGIKAFVPFTLQSEVVKASIFKLHNSFVECELLEIIEASESRTAPLCPYFASCGGCELQHAKDEHQLTIKEALIINALKYKIPGFEKQRIRQEDAAVKRVRNQKKKEVSTNLEDRDKRRREISNEIDALLLKLSPIVKGPFRGYRRKVSLHSDKNNRIGFYKRDSQEVVSISACLISTKKINEFIKKISSEGEKIFCGKVFKIIVEEADNEGINATFMTESTLLQEEIRLMADSVSDICRNYRIISRAINVYTSGSSEIKLSLYEGAAISFPPATFSQVNSIINRLLIRDIVEDALLEKPEHILELYAGAGNFSIPLGLNKICVTAVEIDKQLVEYGQQTVHDLGLSDTVFFVCTSVEKFLKERALTYVPERRDTVKRIEKKVQKQGLDISPITEEGISSVSSYCEDKRKETIDMIIADPPRSGLKSCIDTLPHAKKLVLISCDLASFTRDVWDLIVRGWKVKKIVPYDMFPQTTYIELVTYFYKEM